MKDCFGQAAARLCSAAAGLLGWRPDEFWNATPSELALALEPVPDGSRGPDPDTVNLLRKRFPDT